MPPKSTEFTRIFAKRAACAGITLALGLSLAGCPRDGGKKPDVPIEKITSVFTIGTIALETGDDKQKKPGEDTQDTRLDRLKTALKLAPQEPAIWANMGLMRLRENQLDAAAYDLERAHSLTPPNADPALRAAIESLFAIIADKRGDKAGAVAHYQQAVNLNPDDLLSRNALAGQQEKAGDEAGALQSYQEILKRKPENVEALVVTARLAAKRSDANTLRQAVTRLDALSASWNPSAKQQLATLKTLAQGADVQRVAVNAVFLRNTLKRQAEWHASYAALNPPLDNNDNPVLGVPLERFLVLPNVTDKPAAPDTTITFSEEGQGAGNKRQEGSIQNQSASSPFVGALWLSNVGDAASLVAPFAMQADGHALRIDAPAYQNVSLPFPGGPKAVPPGPNGVLALDFNYDLRADLFLAGAGGIKLYMQDEKRQFADATAQMKLPPDVVNGAYAGAWGLDYDLDGDLDILLARVSGPPLALRCNGDGTFKAVSLFGEVTDLRAFVWADLDGDGSPDAALVDAKGQLHVYMNMRSGKFVSRLVPADIGSIAALTAADIDNDGTIDLVLLRQDGTVLRLSDRMSGTRWNTAVLAEWPNAPKDLAPGTARVFAADLDNNGALDVIASGSTIAQAWLSDGAKLAPLPSPISAGVGAIADIDNNGRLDLIGLDANSRPIVLTNKGTQSYFWQDIRPRAHQAGEVDPSHHRQNSSPEALSKRINSYGIGGEIEVRAGLLYQKQVIMAPSVHFGMGTYPTLDVARIVWPNGDVRGEFELKDNAIFSLNHRLSVSCPFLFTWNGEEMEFVTDCIWRSPLGLKINAQETFGIQMTEDWVKIRGDQLKPREGKREKGKGRSEQSALLPSFYDLRITAELWETHFFDHLSLMVVDHPVGTEVLCDERFAVPPPPLQIYFTTPPQSFARVRDDDGNDVTDLVHARDGRHVANFPMGEYQGVTREHWVELEFGEDTNHAEPLYLIANGWIRPTNSNVNVALSQGDNPVPQGLSIEAQDANGNWVIRRQDLGFPEGKVKTIVLRVDDVFLPDAPRRLRLRTNLEVYWDALHWAHGLPDTPHQITRLAAQTADLHYRGFSQIEAVDDTSPELPVSYDKLECRTQKWRDLTGYYTRYGDIRNLLDTVDDRYVIMNAGDEMRLTFDAPAPPPDGWTRDFVLVGDGWVKDGNYNTTFSKTVLPLPAHDQPDYNTPPMGLEDDPIYQRHSEDWQEYHTRYVTPAIFARGLRPRTTLI